MKRYLSLVTLAFLSSHALAQTTPNAVLGVTSEKKDLIVVNRAITEAEVHAAEKAWCNALISISDTYAQKGQPAAKELAQQVLKEAYGYDMGIVLFKPTLTEHPNTFRTTKEGALSYFVGGNPNFPEDTGFALKGWKGCTFEDAGMFISGTTAISMGRVILTNKEGKKIKVDKTFAYEKDDRGTLQIIAHHSSLEHVDD